MFISKDQYQEWLENPVTSLYRQYLADLLTELRKEQTPACYPNSLDELVALGTRATVAATQMQLLSDLVDLEFTDIEQFYGEDNER